MNGLVGYGSSDDENEHLAPASAGKPRDGEAALMNGRKIDALSDQQRMEETHKASEYAMVGPSMPDDASATAVDTYEDEAEQTLPPMSEKDLLRYLTQPSCPMTSLPPEATSAADPAITAKFKRFIELKARGVHFNQDLAGKSSFKNPNLFASLLERSGLSAETQYASTLPSNVFSVDKLPPWAYKEELLKSQQALVAEMEAHRKAQSAAGKRTIEFTSAGEARSREHTPKRSHR